MLAPTNGALSVIFVRAYMQCPSRLTRTARSIGRAGSAAGDRNPVAANRGLASDTLVKAAALRSRLTSFASQGTTGARAAARGAVAVLAREMTLAVVFTPAVPIGAHSAAFGVVGAIDVTRTGEALELAGRTPFTDAIPIGAGAGARRAVGAVDVARGRAAFEVTVAVRPTEALAVGALAVTTLVVTFALHVTRWGVAAEVALAALETDANPVVAVVVIVASHDPKNQKQDKPEEAEFHWAPAWCVAAADARGASGLRGRRPGRRVDSCSRPASAAR